MKRIFNSLLLTLSTVCSINDLLSAQSTDTAVLMTCKAFRQVNANEFEFSVYLTNTGNVVIPMRGYSWGINVSSELKTAGLSHRYVSRDAELNSLPKPSLSFSNLQLRGTTTNAAPGAEVSIQPGKSVCLATVIVSCASGWPSTCYNPFLPLPGKNPPGAGPMQIVTEGGKSQCLISCAGYMIYANANANTANAVYGLRVEMQPTPGSENAFKLNCK